MTTFTALTLLVFVLGTASSHKWDFDRCPEITSMPNFDLSKFLGKWYISEIIGGVNSCMSLTFADEGVPSTINVIQRREYLPLTMVNLKHIGKYEGKITLDDTKSSSMTVRWPANILGAAGYYVLETDYDNIAVIFECQKIWRFSRRSLAILSRTRNIDQAKLDQARAKIQEHKMDPTTLNPVVQENCVPENETDFSFTIDDKLFGGGIPDVVQETLGEVIPTINIPETFGGPEFFQGVDISENLRKKLNESTDISENLILDALKIKP